MVQLAVLIGAAGATAVVVGWIFGDREDCIDAMDDTAREDDAAAVDDTAVGEDTAIADNIAIIFDAIVPFDAAVAFDAPVAKGPVIAEDAAVAVDACVTDGTRAPLAPLTQLGTSATRYVDWIPSCIVVGEAVKLHAAAPDALATVE